MAETVTEGRVRIYSRDQLPPDEAFGEYHRTDVTRAVQATGPFKVVTQHGIVSGSAGDWVAIDANGWPYPIANDVFQKSYEQADAPVERALYAAKELDRLAAFVMEEVEGEPSESEGVVDTVIRLLRNFIEADQSDHAQNWGSPSE